MASGSRLRGRLARRRQTADGLNELLAACGVGRSHLRAIADTDARGGPVVRLEGVAEGWLSLEELLCLAAHVRRESA
ncbi:hypothetical protein OH807_23335 [Kitasatospora sp. NBC_01560]|uniref:hypothetical protein n=1 Tax=Kitasatospora sp. NBC_01560 TaxID=2975965 RepID=UPI00386968F4